MHYNIGNNKKTNVIRIVRFDIKIWIVIIILSVEVVNIYWKLEPFWLNMCQCHSNWISSEIVDFISMYEWIVIDNNWWQPIESKLSLEFIHIHLPTTTIIVGGLSTLTCKVNNENSWKLEIKQIFKVLTKIATASLSCSISTVN